MRQCAYPAACHLQFASEHRRRAMGDKSPKQKKRKANQKQQTKDDKQRQEAAAAIAKAALAGKK